MMISYWCAKADPGGLYVEHLNYRNLPLYQRGRLPEIGSPSESQWLVPGTFDEDGNHIDVGEDD